MQWRVAVCSVVLSYFVIGTSPYVVDLKKDFSNIYKDEKLAAHVKPIMERLKTFKVFIHPRIRIFYELLKKDITNYAHRTSDTLYNIDKYNKFESAKEVPPTRHGQ